MRRILADAVRSCAGLHLQSDKIDTNIVIFHVDPKLGTAEQFADRLKEQGVLVYDIAGQSIRMVTHMEITSADIGRTAETIRRLTN